MNLDGWNEESPYPRTSETIVEELHTVLQKSDILLPYILVGHSFGGANVQLFAKRYASEALRGLSMKSLV